MSESVIIRGEQVVRFVSGTFDVHGVIFSAGSELSIPLGKSACVEMSGVGPIIQAEGATRLACSTDMSEFSRLCDEISERSFKRIIVLGSPDSGKTFLTTRLLNFLISRRGQAGVIDCDIGQSDIGPPGCLGASLTDRPIVFMSDAPVTGVSFVGAHSPEGHQATVLVGLHKLLKVLERHTDTIIVDTCGWVNGDGARLLKSSKIDIVEPDCVIVLQRQRELEHLVRHLTPGMVRRLSVSGTVRATSVAVRKQIREQLSRRYFQDAGLFSLPFDHVRTMGVYFRSGHELLQIEDERIMYAEDFGPEGCLYVSEAAGVEDLRFIKSSAAGQVRFWRPGQEKGILVGLLDGERRTLGLGLIERVDFQTRSITIRSPLANASEIKILFFGSLKYDIDGIETGFIVPGQF